MGLIIVVGLIQCDGRQVAHKVDHLLIFLVVRCTLHLCASSPCHSGMRLLSFGSGWGTLSRRCEVLRRSASQLPARDPVSLLGLLVVIQRFLSRSVTAIAPHRVKAFRQRVVIDEVLIVDFGVWVPRSLLVENDLRLLIEGFLIQVW